jgi:hypothetical protein
MALSDFIQSWEAGGQAGREKRTRRTLSEYMQPALGGDQAAQQAIYNEDPDIGFRVQGMAREQTQQTAKSVQDDFTQFSRLYTAAPEPIRQQMYAGWRQRAIKAGLPAEMPEAYDPQSIRVAEAVSGTAKEGYTLSPGAKRFGADNRLVAEAPFAPARPDYQLYEGADGPAWLPKPTGGTAAAGGTELPGQLPVRGGPALDPTQDFPRLASAVPGVQNTSLFRDPKDNSRVGGVANSQHMEGTAGDFVVPAPQRQKFIQQAREMGYEAIDEGDHVHVELPPGQQAVNRFGAGQGLAAIPIQGVRPKRRDDQYQTLTPQEVTALGLPSGTVAQRSAAGQVQIINKPRDLPTGGQVIDNGDGTTTYIPAGKITEGERNASGFYQRMIAANEEMSRITKSGYDPTNRRDFYTAGGEFLNPLASNEGQQYRQSQENWVRANLRKESGAAIGVAEMDQERKNYFPIPGDGPDVIAQKARNRQVTERAMRQAAGGGLAPPGSSAETKAPTRVNSEQDYNALPSGSLYIAPDGTQRRKK